jgi:8-oxo-dGTP diphosphatase
MKRGIDYIGVGVGAAIINPEGKLFLTLRGKEAKNERGKWEIPGGSVEFGETLEDALKREIMEEHGVEIAIVELLDVCSHIINDEHQHWVSPTYICTIVSGTPVIKEPHKCDEIGWFTLDEANQLPLSIVTLYDISIFQKKYPCGLESLADKIFQ